MARKRAINFIVSRLVYRILFIVPLRINPHLSFANIYRSYQFERKDKAMKDENLSIKIVVMKIIDGLPLLEFKTREFFLSSLLELFHIRDLEERRTYANVIFKDIQEILEGDINTNHDPHSDKLVSTKRLSQKELKLIEDLKNEFCIKENGLVMAA